MTTTGIGMIGFGQIARQRYVPMLKRRPDVEIVAICTGHPDTAERAAARLGGTVAHGADFQEVVRHPRVDAVIISTPHRLHAAQATSALEAGKHVLLEKPMATSWDDAARLIDAAHSSRATAMILPYEHVAQLDTMLTCLNPDSLGRIVSISADFSGPGVATGPTASQGGHWKYSLQESGGGVIVAHAVYALDLIASIMGPAHRVTAFANTLFPARTAGNGTPIRSDIDDNAVVLLEYATGQQVAVRSCWGYPYKQRNLTIQGTRRCLIMTFGGVYLTPPRRDMAGSTQTVDSVYFPRQRLERIHVQRETENIVDHFIRCINTNTVPRANIDQAAHVTEQMMKAYESARTGSSQALSTSFTRPFDPDRRLYSG